MITEKTEIYNTDDTVNIEKAGKILRDGGLVAIPTETVYGLAANAYDTEAVKRIFEAKGRPQDNPLIVHISKIEELYPLVTEVPEKALECAKRFWAGPLTMIFKKSDKVPDTVSAGLDTVAVRMPSNGIARAIISAAGVPLAAPSANLSGSPSPTTAKRVVDDLDGRVDMIVMSHDCEVGVESTVVLMASDKPRLLRPGAVTLEQLREIMPDIEVDKAVTAEPEKDKPVASPGMKYKHYSPATEVYLIESDSEKYINFVNSKKGNIAALCFEDEKDKIKCKTVVYGKRDDGLSEAHRLFEALRVVDETGVDAAYAHAPEKYGVGLAVYNRLIRAAGFKVIKL